MGAKLSSLPPPVTPPAKTTGLAVAALVLVLYARYTTSSLRAHHAVLSRQEEGRLARGEHVRAVLRYTFWGQFFAASQYVVCLVKPSLGWRILRSFIWKPRDAVRGIAYGLHARNTLDLYGVSAAGSEQNKPVVVFVHGGTWTRGSKWVYALVGEFLAVQGALVAVVNYRTFPTGSALEMVDDVNQAVRRDTSHMAREPMEKARTDAVSCVCPGSVGDRPLPRVRRRRAPHLSGRSLGR